MSILHIALMILSLLTGSLFIGAHASSLALAVGIFFLGMAALYAYFGK